MIAAQKEADKDNNVTTATEIVVPECDCEMHQNQHYKHIFTSAKSLTDFCMCDRTHFAGLDVPVVHSEAVPAAVVEGGVGRPEKRGHVAGAGGEGGEERRRVFPARILFKEKSESQTHRVTRAAVKVLRLSGENICANLTEN